MKIHAREQRCRQAESDLRDALIKIWKKHDLTASEALRVCASILSDEIQAYAKFAIRIERHGDADKPGGLE